MADTLNEKEANGTAAEQQGRTFTQDEVNAIVEGRLKKESAKYADYESLKAKASKLDELEEEKKSELQKATEKADELQKQLDSLKKSNEIRAIREKVSNETGIPMNLLTGDSEEACRAIADNIASYTATVAKQPVAPKVKDSGEVHVHTVTKADILAIKDEKARLKAIEDNIDLF